MAKGEGIWDMGCGKFEKDTFTNDFVSCFVCIFFRVLLQYKFLILFFSLLVTILLTAIYLFQTLFLP